ncbi:hypothetical protein H8356DRAFT_1009954 [Neocallimastix lanati (nom. inval.)]|nr:hypothetical protein H8356DRAFT_1009954 [Neocallimastix sp. JGI-2020a]
MKLFRRNQNNKKPDENYEKFLNESELEPYPYTPTLDAEDISLGDSLLQDGEIEGRYVNNTQQSFTVMTGKSRDDSQSTIKNQKSHFNDIQVREVNNKNTSFVVRDSELYGDDLSSIHGSIGKYDDLESVTDTSSTVTSNNHSNNYTNSNNHSTKSSTQYTRTTRDEISETTSNYQNSSENNYGNLKTQSIHATPIFSGFLYKLGRNKRWQWRMFCFDGMSLACLSSKCKPKYVIPLDKVESIKLLHRNAPEYKPNTFVITVEKNDCKGKMDEGFFPYSEASISDDPYRPRRTFSMGYYSYLLRAKTSVDLERWMFVLLTMYGVMKRERMMNMQSFNISSTPPQPLFTFDNSYNPSSNNNMSFQSLSDGGSFSGNDPNDYNNNNGNNNNDNNSLDQPSNLSNLRLESRRNKNPKGSKQTFNNPYVISKDNSSSESVIVSSIMKDFIFDDYNKNEEIDDSLKEYAVQSLRLFSLAEQKAVVEDVQQAWSLGREEDEEMLDILVQELRQTPVKVENNRESIISQMAEIEIMDDNASPNQNTNDNTFISFAAWRTSIASLLNLDNEMNVSLGLSNFCPTLPRKSGSLSRTSSLPMEKFPSGTNNAAAYNKSLGRNENNAITPRMVNNTRLAGFNTINRNQSKAIYLGDIAEESDSGESDSDDDELSRPVRKDSMNHVSTKKNRMSYIPKSRPFSYYLGKK